MGLMRSICALITTLRIPRRRPQLRSRVLLKSVRLPSVKNEPLFISIELESAGDQLMSFDQQLDWYRAALDATKTGFFPELELTLRRAK